jgi:hypothetical protein
MKTPRRHLIPLFLASALLAGVLSAQTIYVGNVLTHSISSYDTNGTALNTNLISGIDYPRDLAVSDGYLYVLDRTSGTLGKYNLDGSVVQANLVTGLNAPEAFTISGSNIYVANTGAGTVGHYSTAGATLNANLITGLTGPAGIAVSGSNLFVAAGGGANGNLYQYSTAGTGGTALLGANAMVNYQLAASGSNLYYLQQISGWYTLNVFDTGTSSSTALVTNINAATDVFLSGPSLLVASAGGQWTGDSMIGLYGTGGVPVDDSLIQATYGSFYSVASASAVPEPSTYAALAGLAALGGAIWRRRALNHAARLAS